MKDAMWRVDPVYGVRYRDPHNPDQAMLDIELEPDSAPLLTMLTGRLSVRPRTLDELRDYALTETVYRPQQVRPLVQQQLTDQRYSRQERGHLRADSVISLAGTGPPPEQGSLFGHLI